MEKEVIRETLRKHGFRATPARIDVLRFLSTQARPVGIEVIQKASPQINTVTLYRMMADFEKVGIVSASDLGHGHVDYEIEDRPHHHHAVCESCGLVEDVYPCDKNKGCSFEKAILNSSTLFAEIKKQQTVFFGLCKRCKKKKAVI